MGKEARHRLEPEVEGEKQAEDLEAVQAQPMITPFEIENAWRAPPTDGRTDTVLCAVPLPSA